MNRVLRACLLATLVAGLAGLGAWRVAIQAEGGGSAAGQDGVAADGIRSARAALAMGDTATAAARARAVLAREPLDGTAFALLAQALAGQGSDADVFARYAIAARRAPRDVHVRSWMAAHFLEAGDYPAALSHIDTLLTVSPPSRATLVPMLARLAQDPAFADALAAHLARSPRWRGAVLQQVGAGPGASGDRLFEALRRGGNLSADEEARWINGMLKANRWGSAYARWVGGLPATDRLPLLHNGSFETAPTSSGFDWHVARVSGVVFRRGSADGSGGGARLTFLGRPVADTGLSHPLLLAPGRYRLSMRVRAPELRADQGLEWVIACATGSPPAHRGARITATRDWQAVDMAFEIPPAGCDGQWLKLLNPAPAGVAQVVRGELQLDAIAIAPAG